MQTKTVVSAVKQNITPQKYKIWYNRRMRVGDNRDNEG